MNCEYAWTDFEGEHFCDRYARFKVLDEADPCEAYHDGDLACGRHVGDTVGNVWGGRALVRQVA